MTVKNYLPTQNHLHFLFYVEEWEQWESWENITAKSSKAVMATFLPHKEDILLLYFIYSSFTHAKREVLCTSSFCSQNVPGDAYQLRVSYMLLLKF